MFRSVVAVVVMAILLIAIPAFSDTSEDAQLESQFQTVIDDVWNKSQVKVSKEDLRVFVRIGHQYQVHWQLLVSIWYEETICGSYLGKQDPFRVYEQKIQAAKLQRTKDRWKRERQELTALLTDLSLSQVKGSCAGAIGTMQFMPSTWAKHGIDGNNDGHKNPWDLADAAATAAHFLTLCEYKKIPFNAVTQYNGGMRRNQSIEHYANVVTRRAGAWGAPLDFND